MKIIIVCFPNGQAIKVNVPLGIHITEVACIYPNTNLYWLDAPADCHEENRKFITYTPE